MLKKKISNQKTVEELIAAGRDARAHGLLTEAIKQFQSALDNGLSSVDQEASVRCHLAEALEKAGLYTQLLDTLSKYDRPVGLRHLSRIVEMQVLIRLGWSSSMNNDAPRSIALFNQVLRSAQHDDLAIIAACHRGLGRAYRICSEIQFARDHYTMAGEYYRRIGDPSELAENYIGLSYVDFNEGAYQEAANSANAAIALLQGSCDTVLLGMAYDRLAAISFFLDDLITVSAMCKKCLENARQSGARGLMMSAANNYAISLAITGEWVQAEEIARYGLEISSQTSSPAFIANSLDTLARIHLLRGRISEADDLLAEALRLTGSIKPGDWIETTIQISMGRSCLAKGLAAKAISHFHRAIEICEKLGNLQQRPEVCVRLAEALFETGNIEETRAVVQSTLSELRRSPNLEAWGYLSRMVARLEINDGRYSKAIQYLSQSSSTFELRDVVYERAINRIILARIWENSDQFERAISETERALAVFERLGAIDVEPTTAYLLKLRNRQREQVRDLSVVRARQPSDLELDRISILDDSVTERILDSSVSRKLLLHDLGSIVVEQASARGAVVFEICRDNRLIAASTGIDAQEQQELLEQITDLTAGEHDRRFIYQFGDIDNSAFLLQIIEPEREFFVNGNVNLRPLLRLVEHELQRYLLKSQVRRRPVFDPSLVLGEAEISGFICKGPAMTKVLEQIHKIRSSNAAVLITGESGSGKELVARAVHAASARKFGTFLPFNCSSVSREMVESQLFGFRKGSFTGASANSEGVIRAAEHGTLFLDEIGEMPIDLQPKLLRFLQEGEIHPLGESKPIKVDVRLVAATNVDLEHEVAKGRFREDLFYRLNVIRVHVPPLRERREEIPALIAYYLKQDQKEEGKTDIALSQEAIDLMIVYDWPGNVRQLCNELRRLVAYNESGSTLNVDALSPEIVGPGQVWFSKPERPKVEKDLTLVETEQTLAEATDELERNMIQAALRRSSGNIAQAAKELGLSRGGLYLKMNRLKLQA